MQKHLHGLDVIQLGEIAQNNRVGKQPSECAQCESAFLQEFHFIRGKRVVLPTDRAIMCTFTHSRWASGWPRPLIRT